MSVRGKESKAEGDYVEEGKVEDEVEEGKAKEGEGKETSEG